MTVRVSWLLGLGLAAPPIAWFGAQQSTGALTYFACQAARPPLGLLMGLLGLAACLAAGVASLQRRAAPMAFSAQIALGLAAIFGLANLFTLAAVWLVPPCAR
jgi:hypothetical protein